MFQRKKSLSRYNTFIPSPSKFSEKIHWIKIKVRRRRIGNVNTLNLLNKTWFSSGQLQMTGALTRREYVVSEFINVCAMMMVEKKIIVCDARRYDGAVDEWKEKATTCPTFEQLFRCPRALANGDVPVTKSFVSCLLFCWVKANLRLKFLTQYSTFIPI